MRVYRVRVLCYDIIIGYYLLLHALSISKCFVCVQYALAALRSNDLGDRFRHYTNAVVQYYTAVTRSLRLYYYYGVRTVRVLTINVIINNHRQI